MQCAVRFSCGDASAEEQAELAQELAALDGTQIVETGPGGGEPFADIIIVALITVGGPIVSDAVKTFGKWLLSRRSGGSQATDRPDHVTIEVEGLRGSITITMAPDTDAAQLDLAAVGTVTEIREAE